MTIAERIIARVSRRPADLVIGDPPYLRRWYVLPRNRLFNIYLHNILRSDDDRALHDHPWVNCSIVLRGGYLEMVATPGATTRTLLRNAGNVVLRGPRQSHRLIIYSRRVETWTLFITGPRLREWGFWCPRGWVHWRDFTAGPNGETVGRGCGDA